MDIGYLSIWLSGFVGGIAVCSVVAALVLRASNRRLEQAEQMHRRMR